jgi:hypothetical protein
MPSNLKRFTRELKEKNALVRKIAQANFHNLSNEFPLAHRGAIYRFLSIPILVNKISKLSKYDRNLLLNSPLLKSIRKNCYTLIVEKNTQPKKLNKLRFNFLIADCIKMIIKYMHKSVM